MLKLLTTLSLISSTAFCGPWYMLTEKCLAQDSDSHDALLVVCPKHNTGAIFSKECGGIKGAKIGGDMLTDFSVKPLGGGNWEFSGKIIPAIGEATLSTVIVIQCRNTNIYFGGNYGSKT